MPYNPLQRGLLAASRRLGTDRSKVVQGFALPSSEAIIDRTIELAQARRVKPAQIALAWLLHNPAVTAPIVGATKVHHLDDAIDALDIVLTEQEMDTLEACYVPQQVRLSRTWSRSLVRRHHRRPSLSFGGG